MNHEDIWKAARNGKLFTIKNVMIVAIENEPNAKKGTIQIITKSSPERATLHNVNFDDISSCDKPKHDPARLFKMGDVVRVVAWNGRDIVRIGQIGRVVSDEHNSRVELAIDGWTSDVYYPACHLELVSPEEELEPYEVECDDDDNEYSVTCRDKFVCTYPYDSDSFYTKKQAKAAAEAECDRLNAEYRKERNNG